MRSRCIVLGLLVLAALTAGCSTSSVVTFGDLRYTISKPAAYRNLAVYVIRGVDRLKGKKVLSLEEGIKQKKLVVSETGNVGQLQVENTSKDEYAYLQSGEIVKGGKQDRTLRYDYIVPPMSGRRPLASFCVESARWSGRGNESTVKFSAGKYVPTVAARSNNIRFSGYNAVTWSEVSRTQLSYGRNIMWSVKDAKSPTSMQLTLEHAKVKATTKEYTDAVRAAFDRYNDAIGFAYAINGTVQWVDVYASGELFRKLLPKLLDASAQEAIIEFQKGKTFSAPSAGAVRAFMLAARQGKVTERRVSNDIKSWVQDSENGMYFQIFSAGPDKKWTSFHEGYSRKVEKVKPKKRERPNTIQVIDYLERPGRDDADRRNTRPNALMPDGDIRNWDLWTPEPGD